MENMQNLALLAGLLLAVVVIYIVGWRIVEGANAVVRTATRVLLGALIVVPAMLFLLYGNQSAMLDKVGSPAPVGGSSPKDIAKPDKKRAAPPVEQESNTATAEEHADKAAESKVAEKSKELAEGSSESEAQQNREKAKLDPRKNSKEAKAKPETTATSKQPTENEAAELTSVEPAAGADEEASKNDEAAVGSGSAKRKKPTRRYHRSYSHKPPASANGGGSQGSVGGHGTSGSGGANLTLEELDNKPANPPAAGAPDRDGFDTDSIINLGVSGRDDDNAGSEPPGEAATEEAASPDVALNDIVPGAGAPVVSSAAEEVTEDWSVVPVYYGTDRARADKEKRIGYDWQRGRRLELGRALVTIPKEHVVPMVERPWAIKIPYVDIVLYEAAEDPKKHFTMKELNALTKEEFLKLVKERLQKSARFKDHALVFIHGYKTKFDNAVYRTAQIAYDLKFDGAPFLYSWPSGGTLQGYTYDRESSGQAEIHLRKFLEMVRDETGAKKVSIIAHSMGNQLLLRTLQDMKRSMPDGVQISQLILAAPDVDRDSFQHIVKSIAGIAEGITLYAAANDTALAFSRQVNGGVPRAGDVPESGPIIMEGIDTIDATATSMDSVGINHSGYAENNALLEDIGRLVSAGIRPPGLRLPKLESVETDQGTYWRYPAAQ